MSSREGPLLFLLSSSAGAGGGAGSFVCTLGEPNLGILAGSAAIYYIAWLGLLPGIVY